MWTEASKEIRRGRRRREEEESQCDIQVSLSEEGGSEEKYFTTLELLLEKPSRSSSSSSARAHIEHLVSCLQGPRSSETSPFVPTIGIGNPQGGEALAEIHTRLARSALDPIWQSGDALLVLGHLSVAVEAS
ncbi:hypothetical protein VTO42DRAFT_4544 [Malbranchea cinnamomea]